MDTESDQKFHKVLAEELGKRGIEELSCAPYLAMWSSTIQIDGDLSLLELEAVLETMKRLAKEG